MTDRPLNAPISRREFYYEMLAVWLVVLLVASSSVGSDASWRDLLLPAGALGMLVLHAVALRKALRRERSAGRRPPNDAQD